MQDNNNVCRVSRLLGNANTAIKARKARERADKAEIAALRLENKVLNDRVRGLQTSFNESWGTFRQMTEYLIRDVFGCTDWTPEQSREFDDLMSFPIAQAER